MSEGRSLFEVIAEVTSGWGTTLIVDIPGSATASARRRLTDKAIILRPAAATLKYPDLFLGVGFAEGCQPVHGYTQDWLPGNESLDLLPSVYSRPGEYTNKDSAKLKLRPIDQQLAGIRQLDWFHIADISFDAILHALDGASGLITRDQCVVSIDMRDTLSAVRDSHSALLEKMVGCFGLAGRWLLPGFFLAGKRKQIDWIQSECESTFSSSVKQSEKFETFACSGFRDVERLDGLSWRWSCEQSVRFLLPRPLSIDSRPSSEWIIELSCFFNDIEFNCFADGTAIAPVIQEDKVIIPIPNRISGASIMVQFSFANYPGHGALGIAPHTVRIIEGSK